VSHSRQRVGCLLSLICLFGLVGVGGCSVTPNLSPPSPAPSATPAPSSTPVPSATPVPPTAQGILACDSSVLALPESVLQTGTVLDHDERTQALFARADQQVGWLAVHLELVRTTVSYASPIPFRLLIFVRPRYVGILSDPSTDWPVPADLFVRLVSSFGQVMQPALAQVDVFSPDLIRGDFTMLAPGQSCALDMHFPQHMVSVGTWPLPAGDYTMQVLLVGADVGPQTESGEWLDVNGWVGGSELSNSAIFTVLPQP
jgi:hypothetical protein